MATAADATMARMSGPWTGPARAGVGAGAGPAGALRSPDDALQEILEAADAREKFIPVTRAALFERLMRPQYWPPGEAANVGRFFRYLDYWRQQSYGALLLRLEQLYEPFSPDSDLLITRRFSAEERRRMQAELVAGIETLLRQANYTAVDPSNVELILTKESHYGLDLHVDLKAFDVLSIFYRGATKRREARRTIKKLYLRKEEFDVPIFQRLFIMFKLKPEAARIQEIMTERNCSFEEAERHVRRLRSALPPQISSDNVYLKLFKNMPRTDIEMVFPNTQVRFRLFDKLKLGVTAGGGLGMGVVGTAGKIAVASNPIALAGAVAGLGAVAFRQAMNFMNQRNKYMITMAQNLYFHAMADNRGVMTLLADRAAEEDIKEEVLLYSVLAKAPVARHELPDVDRAIEQNLLNTFGINVNFDVSDALSRLERDGLVSELADGTLRALPPGEAAAHIDRLWDGYLDALPPVGGEAGEEFDFEENDAEAVRP